MGMTSALLSTREALRPHREETPAEYASRLASRFAAHISLQSRRELAQFFTPLDVARFMASLARPDRPVQRIIDPGAGTGVLACAVCEVIPSRTGRVHLDAYEVDPALASMCHMTLAYAKAWLAARGTIFDFTIHQADYVTQNPIVRGLFDTTTPIRYDIAVANPPYFKLHKFDPRAVAASAVIHGQPNIYAIFMAVTASLLSEGGVMVTITPRSFATGDYFRRFRQHLFAAVVPEAVHLFHSRKEAFRSDAVLQENVILRARKAQPSPSATVAVSASAGAADLDHRRIRNVPLASVVDLGSRNVIFNIPADESDDEVIRFVRSWPTSLHHLGLEVSTGPVVAFRARKFLVHEPAEDKDLAPLLWLQNIRRMTVQWPSDRSAKAQYIRDSLDSRGLLVRNATYVLLRRFTAKEERRRLTAAPLFCGQLPGRAIGLENHLNYIHRPHGEIGRDEAIGLAALLGSALLDRYFRVSSGTTQVNAVEVRALPLPSRGSIMTLGNEIGRQSLGPRDTEEAVAEILRVPRAFLKGTEVEAIGEG